MSGYCNICGQAHNSTVCPQITHVYDQPLDGEALKRENTSLRRQLSEAQRELEEARRVVEAAKRIRNAIFFVGGNRVGMINAEILIPQFCDAVDGLYAQALSETLARLAESCPTLEREGEGE